MMPTPRIQSASNYRLFERSIENRPLDMTHHKNLVASMKQYGFLKCFPIVVERNAEGKFVVKDGQHRLTIAESLGLPVYYVEEDIDFDVAVVNCTSKTWKLKDYAQKFAMQGLPDYKEALAFAEEYQLAFGTVIALLSGSVSGSNADSQFIAGDFKIKDRDWAHAVARLFKDLLALSPALKNKRVVEACMAVCRVDDFDASRLLGGAKRCREKLLPLSTRDANLDLLEMLYNFGRASLVGLKAAALMAIRERNPAKKKK